MATHSVLGSSPTSQVTGVKVDVVLPELRDILERLCEREIVIPAPIVNVAPASVTTEPPRVLCSPEIKIEVPEIKIPQTIVNVEAPDVMPVHVTVTLGAEPLLYLIAVGVYSLLGVMSYLLFHLL
jgi:hypothetical protein